jgi:hypothetical protein
VATILGSMTTIVVMGGRFLFFFVLVIAFAQLHQGSFFRKKEVEEVLVLGEKS